MDEQRKFVIGVQAVYVRCPDGIERQLEAAQDCQITGKLTQVKKMGDDAVAPLYILNASKEVKISGKYAKTSVSLMTFLMGGTKTAVASEGYSQPEADTADCSMKNAITINSSTVGDLLTDMYSFFAISATQYNVVKMSDGSVLGPFDVAGYPRTDVVPGLNITVNGTLVVGSVANVKTAATGETVEVRDEDANDVPGRLAVRVVTEPDNDGNQFSVLFYSCVSAGSTVALATKTVNDLDFEFEAFEDSTLGKLSQWVSLTKPAATPCP